MFDDRRSKRLVITAHCLLNQNSKSDGTADLPGQFEEVVNLIMGSKTGIIQLPCPELLCLGLDRRDKDGAKRDVLEENTRIRNLMEEQENLDILKTKAREVGDQIVEYGKHGFKTVGLIGVNRSPSCGIDSTSIANREETGRGVFMDLVERELKSRGSEIKMVGVKSSRIEESVERVKELLEG